MGPFLSGKKQGPSVAHKKAPRGPDKPGMQEWARKGALGIGGKFCPRFYAERAGAQPGGPAVV